MTPSTISPSDGMNSPAFTITRSFLRNEEAGTGLGLPAGGQPVRHRLGPGLRNVSACALPRPSAIASARLANRTVAHSQAVICSSKPILSAPVTRSRARIAVVRVAPTPTTNMTGFLIITRGSSFRHASTAALRTNEASQILSFCVFAMK